MNAYYNKNEQFISNNRTYTEYFTESAKSVSKWLTLPEILLSILFSLLRFLSGARVRNIVRVCAVAVSLVGFIGVLGAVERGTLSLLGGVLLGGILLGIEYLALRPSKKTK